MSALAIPRLRVRVRRRRKKPKPFDWWLWASLYAAALYQLADDALKLAADGGSVKHAFDAGANVLLACAWRRAMRHADPDDDCVADWRRVFIFWVGGVALAVAAVFV